MLEALFPVVAADRPFDIVIFDYFAFSNLMGGIYASFASTAIKPMKKYGFD